MSLPTLSRSTKPQASPIPHPLDRQTHGGRTALNILLAGSFLVCVRASDLQTVKLKPVADTSLHQIAGDNNLGAQTHVAAGGTGHDSRSRGLFRFDLSAIPTNAVVRSAQLTLRVTGVPGGGGAASIFGLHRLNVPWSEGTKVGNLGSTASPGETTWKARFAPDTLWSAPGGAAPADFADTASASRSVAGGGSYAFASTADLVADVQSWVSTPSANQGWILMSESEKAAFTARRFGSREDAANAPELEVRYLPAAAEPVALRFDNMSHDLGSVQIRFGIPATAMVALEFVDSMSLTNWTVLTNMPASMQAADAVVNDPMGDRLARFYRLRLTGQLR